ncbi:MAG: ABC transporter ATP-binding protein [Candidatus Omnitrophota bacterium]|jgi:iron complex transport system ATP-binding protein|nr:MAG: ABC transporter ATP-binding protein [Candidatus Omnitrophota bacterium]
MIELKGITAGYLKNDVLHDISLKIEDGQFTGIIGPNGSGKSTLLRVISRYIQPSAGKITYKEKDLLSFNPHELSCEFAFVPQSIDINFSFTVMDIAMLGRIPFLKRTQWESKADYEIAAKALELTGTYKLKDRFIHELSAGEKQMVIIAKALTQKPKVLLLDEPTSHLDIGHQVQMLNLLKQLNKNEKITVVIVLHDLNLASEYCDKIVMLHEGMVSKIGQPEEVLTYQNIENVYKTLVIVNKNPISGKPHVLLVAKNKY